MNNQEAFEKIMNLNVKNYDYIINDITNVKRVGLIAQEVDANIENVVFKSSHFLPNVLLKCVAINNTSLEYKITDSNIHPKVNKNDIIMIYDSENNKIYTKIYEIHKIDNTKYILHTNTNNFTNNKTYIIYGTEVNDFHSIDYNQILCLLISAFQKLATDTL